jgi:hypothetical protein
VTRAGSAGVAGADVIRRALLGVAGGVVTSLMILWVLGLVRGGTTARTRLVAEDASAPLRRIAIHYAPAADRVALPVWNQLFAVLPASVEVEVEVAAAPDFDRLVGKLTAAGVGHLDRLHPVVVGAAITTWSRDRYAAEVDDRGEGSILAPPRRETSFASRAGDGRSPVSMCRKFAACPSAGSGGIGSAPARRRA